MAEMAGAFEIFSKKELGGVEKWTIHEVGEHLRRQTPGIVIFDNDFTLKPAAYELGMGGKELEEVQSYRSHMLLPPK